MRISKSIPVRILGGLCVVMIGIAVVLAIIGAWASALVIGGVGLIEGVLCWAISVPDPETK